MKPSASPERPIRGDCRVAVAVWAPALPHPEKIVESRLDDRAVHVSDHFFPTLEDIVGSKIERYWADTALYFHDWPERSPPLLLVRFGIDVKHVLKSD